MSIRYSFLLITAARNPGGKSTTPTLNINRLHGISGKGVRVYFLSLVIYVATGRSLCMIRSRVYLCLYVWHLLVVI